MSINDGGITVNVLAFLLTCVTFGMLLVGFLTLKRLVREAENCERDVRKRQQFRQRQAKE
jgi:hypothetical protein